MKSGICQIMCSLLLVLVLMISSVECTCTADMMEKAKKACVPINIDVYKPLSDTSGKEAKWITAISGGAQTIEDFFALGRLHILNFAITQIAQNLGIGSIIGDINKDNIKFQSKVNKAFEQMQKCMDEKIYYNDASLAKTDFQVAAELFLDLKNIWHEKSTDEEYNEKFYTVWNQLHIVVNKHLDLSKDIWKINVGPKKYATYLPVFIEGTELYHTISLAYLSHLRYNKLENEYKATLKIIKGDATDITHWIISARDQMVANLALNQYTIMDQWNVNDIVSNFEAHTCWNSCPIKPISLTWGNANHAGFLAHPISVNGWSSVNWNSITGLTNTDGTIINCQNNIMNCPVDKDECWMCKTRYSASASCKNMIRTVVVNNLNEYRTSVKVKQSEWEGDYFKHTTKLNNALAKL